MTIHNPVARFFFGRAFDVFDVIAIVTQAAVIGAAAWIAAWSLSIRALDWLP